MRQADEIVRRSGGSLEINSPLYHELCKGLLHAHAEMYRVQAARLRGHIHAAARLPLNPALAEPFGTAAATFVAHGALPPVSGPSFSEAYPQFLATLTRDHGKRNSTAEKYRATSEKFVKVVGDQPARSYTKRDHVTPFLDLLRELPPDYDKAKRWRGMGLQEIAAANKKEGGKRLSGKSVLNHLTGLGSFFEYLKDRGEYEGENPARGFKLKRHIRSAKRELWEGYMLRKLLDSPVWTGCKSEFRRAEPGQEIVRNHYYWLPLLALYHGARLEELAQLRVKDLRRLEDIWFLDITDEGGGKLKTEASRRRVPLHDALIQLGFIEHVQSLGESGFLFPELEPQGADQKRGYSFSKKWPRYRSAVGVYRRGLDFHSFRHGTRTKLVGAAVPGHIIDAITGHEGQTIGDRHYTHREHIPLATLRNAVNKVHWPEASSLLECQSRSAARPLS